MLNRKNPIISNSLDEMLLYWVWAL